MHIHRNEACYVLGNQKCFYGSILELGLYLYKKQKIGILTQSYIWRFCKNI